LAQTLTNGTKGSPRKRKQEPDDDLAAQSSPSKTSKRVKREALSPLDGSLRPSNRSRSSRQKKTTKDVTSETESESQEEQVPVASKKTSKTNSKAAISGHLNLDTAAASTSVKETSRAKAKVEVAESTATEIKDQSATPSKLKTNSKKKVTDTSELDDSGQANEEAAPKKTPGRRTNKAEKEAENKSTEFKGDAGSPSKKKTKSKSKATETVDFEEDEEVDAEVPKNTRRKRKTKEEKEAEAMPLAARTTGLRMFIGAHVSIATGVEKAVTNCVHIGYSLLRSPSLGVHR
jgi:hypothetical protein